VERFWELEQITERWKFASAEQIDSEQNFKQTMHGIPLGRFEVKLSFKMDLSC